MNTPSEIKSMLDARAYCVIGASRDTEKFGYLVLRLLKSAGKTVYPVNPTTDSIGKWVCYPTVNDLPELVDVAVFVVPPPVTERLLPECHALGIKSVWIQEGAESEAAIAYCQANGIAVVAGGPCIMTMMWDED